MQTTQVNGPASMLSGPRQPGKQVDNDGGQGFDQALSREVAGRGEQRSSSSNDKPETAQTPSPARQADGRTAEKTRGPEKSAKADKADKSDEDGGAGSAAADSASQFSAEMLALVAAINSITGQNRPDAAADARADAPALELGTATGKAETDLSAVLGANARDTEAAAAPADGTAGTGELLPGMEIADGKSGKAGEAAFLEAMQESASRMAAATPVAQNPALQAMRHAQPAAADRLTPAVGTPAWDQALGQKVVWMVAGEQQSASLTLNPPDLGPLQVVLSVSNSQASATFTAAQPEVRQALEAALPKLRDMLGEAGIQLGQASVNSGAPNQQGGTDQSGARGNGNGGTGRGGGTGGDSGQRVSTVVRAGGGNGLVDTFA
ncbi:flagellar hook-length control protein FliK [Noviherbaspirillum aridicola]|uniref:Flagellar hook-length control protein n=1 Tax=Noviherbaspirillum aridicola TaxID=2849687 RepID=A0ABQ4Q639_9BURK|nr:flagellar hook-length control protein FliK [Noviherbaspirillum aridicola]GIZ52681.1 flagellar hook-length control protein [Noviherbaspirillum aridicola]